MDQKSAQKQLFFRNLERKLAKRYLLTIENISLVRDLALSKNKTKEQAIEEVEQIIQRKKRSIKRLNIKNIESNNHLNETFRLTLLYFQAYCNLIFFLKHCSEEQWKDLTQRTPLDTHRPIRNEEEVMWQEPGF